MVLANELAVDPPLHIGLISKSTELHDVDLAFIAAAIQQQVHNDLCPIWGLPSVEVAAYRDGADLPRNLTAVIYFVDSDGNPESLGYHAELAGLTYGFIDVLQTRAGGGSLSAVASHEVLELIGNQHLTAWVWVPVLGLYLWRELADPVQDVTYEINVELMGTVRAVEVSDFILPGYFDPASLGPGDFRGRIAPLGITEGGYQIAKTTTDRIVSLPELSAAATRQVRDRLGRTLSRLSRATV